MRTPPRIPVVCGLLAVLSSPVWAQDGAAGDGLASLLSRVFGQTVVLNNPSHAAHFSDPDGTLFQVGQSINQALASQLSTFPVPSTAGGFTYTYDSATGAFNRASDSFGPLFAERAQTIGKGKWTAGIVYQGAEYDKIDDLDLAGGLLFQLTHNDTNSDNSNLAPNFEGDLIGVDTNIAVETETTVVWFNYGVAKRFDFGVAVPFQSVDLSASATLSIDRVATGSVTAIHQFPGGGNTATFAESDSASGIGDVLLRAKYRFSDQGGWALGFEVRVPTGDEEDLLGSGFTQSKVFLIGSTTWGDTFSPHLNVGYAVASGSSDFITDLPDEISYTLGFDVALHPRVTLAIDAIGRTLQDATVVRSDLGSFRFCAVGVAGCPPAGISSVTRPVLVFEEDDVNLLLGAAGLRINLAGRLLLALNATFVLGDEGLGIDGIVPTVGLDYSF